MPQHPGNPGMAPAPAAPAVPPPMGGGMAPTAGPSGAAAKQQIEENANIAIQAGIAAAEAAKAAPDVPDEAAAKIEEGVMLINEGKEAAMAPAAPMAGGGQAPGNPVEGTGAQAVGTREGAR